MSNEQIMDEQFHFAYLSGVLTEFSSEIAKIKEKNLTKSLSEISDDVFELSDGMLSPVMIKNTTLDTTERIYEPGSVEIEYERLYQKQ
jgi:hypothetical protein